MSGLLNLPFPLFDLIDRGLGLVLPPVLRLVLWGILGGAAAMGLYALCSNQGRIKAQKEAIAGLQGRLKAAQDDFAETMRLSRANLRASLGLLGLVTLPAVLSSLPMLFLLVWVAETYAYAPPAPGTPVAAEIVPPREGLTVTPPGSFDPAGGTVRWPAGGEIGLRRGDATLWSAPAAGPRPPVSVHKMRWWNWLYGNPGGYLAGDAPLEEVRFAQAPLDVLGAGPSWLRGWEAVFFTSLVVASLATKRLARIA